MVSTHPRQSVLALPAFCATAAPRSLPWSTRLPSTSPSLTPRGQFVKSLRATHPQSTSFVHAPFNISPVRRPSRPTRYTAQATLLTSLTSFASTSAGIFILGFIVFVHESGHFLAARWQNIRVKTFSIGFGPSIARFTPKNSETEFTIRLLPLGGYVSFPEHVTIDEESGDEKTDPDPNLLQNRPVLDRAIVVSAGVLANIILAWAAIFTSVTWIGLPTYDVRPGVTIAALVDPSGPAARAGLQAGDVVTAVDGRAVAASLESASVVAETIRTSQGRALGFEVLRDGKSSEIRVRPKCCNAEGASSMGVQLVPNASVVRVKAASIGSGLRSSNAEFARLWRQTWHGLQSIVTNFKSTSQNLSGPVGVVSMGADLARNDTGALLTFCAVISINLALINALPLPALDGGQMAFLVVEALRGAPVSLRVQDAINRTALLLFLAFSGVLFFGDLERLNILGALQKMFG